jgi:hypothetical protein
MKSNSLNKWHVAGLCVVLIQFVVMSLGVLSASGTTLCPGRPASGTSPCSYTGCLPSQNCPTNVCKKSCLVDTDYNWCNGSGACCETSPNSEDACTTLTVEGASFNHYRSCCTGGTCNNVWALFPNAAANPMSTSGTFGYFHHCNQS